MSKILLSLALLVSATSFAQTQPENTSLRKSELAARLIDTTYKHRSTVFYANIPGFSFSGPLQLNSILTQQQVPTLNRSVFLAGLGVEERWKWFVAGLDFTMGEQYAENARYDVTSNVTLTNIYLKYYVFKRKDAGGIYPMVSLTTYNQSVYITDKTNTGDINTIFGNSGSTNLFLSTAFVTTGIGFDISDFTKDESFYGSFKIGYRTNVGSDFDNKWYVNESRSLAGSPIERLNGLTLQFSVGYTFNYFSKKQKRVF